MAEAVAFNEQGNQATKQWLMNVLTVHRIYGETLHLLKMMVFLDHIFMFKRWYCYIFDAFWTLLN